MNMRGIRGATCVKGNQKTEIVEATKELLQQLVEANQLKVEAIAAIIFTATKDLNAEFPAAAARELGWVDTPLLCSVEIDVPGSLAKCLRVLILANLDVPQAAVKNVYLREAVKLR
jgi:chorismate mutase